MKRLLKRLAKRWADASLVRANERLSSQNEELESRLRLQQLEIDELAAVVARNLKRVEAETATAARRIAECENQQHVALS